MRYICAIFYLTNMKAKCRSAVWRDLSLPLILPSEVIEWVAATLLITSKCETGSCKQGGDLEHKGKSTKERVTKQSIKVQSHERKPRCERLVQGTVTSGYCCWTMEAVLRFSFEVVLEPASIKTFKRAHSWSSNWLVKLICRLPPSVVLRLSDELDSFLDLHR